VNLSSIDLLVLPEKNGNVWRKRLWLENIHCFRCIEKKNDFVGVSLEGNIDWLNVVMGVRGVMVGRRKGMGSS